MLGLQRNTFQLVVASTENASYAILMFPRRGLQFLYTTVGGTSRLLQTGFNQGQVQGRWWSSQGAYYRISTEEESSLRNLPRYGPDSVLGQGTAQRPQRRWEQPDELPVSCFQGDDVGDQRSLGL